MLRAILISALCCFAGDAATLRAGVAKVDITPATHEIMWGFEDRLTPAASTLDPLYARVLVLEAGQKRLGIVTLDLGRSFGPASVERLKASARRTSGISCLLLAASHTHSAPVIRDENPNGPPEWERVALDKIEHAIEEAAKRLENARIGTGTGMTDIGHNRLQVNADDSVTWFERNPDQQPTKP